MAISKPITRVEQYLAHISGMSVNVPEVPLTREEMYLASWARKSGIEDTEMQGEPPLTLEDCIGEPFNGLVLYGKSTQVTTTGAQLLDILDTERTIRGVTLRIQNGVIEMNGTATESGYAYVDIAKTPLNGTYTLSIDGAVKGALLDDKFQRLIESTRSLNGETACMLAFFVTKDVKYSLTGIKVMLNAGDTTLPWEPYTGGRQSPSPDYPQEIKSVGDDGNVSIIVKNPDNERMQSVSFSTSNGLPGIPVSSGGNYTDEQGQQWICDEVNLERGVYVQRVYSVIVDGVDVFFSQKGPYCNINLRNMPSVKIVYASGQRAAIKSTFTSEPWGFNQESGFLYLVKENYAEILNESCRRHNGEVIYALATPIEPPLSEPDIAAYRALTTYKGTTILESECHLKVKYSKLRK